MLDDSRKDHAHPLTDSTTCPHGEDNDEKSNDESSRYSRCEENEEEIAGGEHVDIGDMNSHTTDESSEEWLKEWGEYLNDRGERDTRHTLE